MGREMKISGFIAFNLNENKYSEETTVHVSKYVPRLLSTLQCYWKNA
jgi:hypothetical protein